MSSALNRRQPGFAEQYEMAQQVAAQYHTEPYLDRPFVEHLAAIAHTLRRFGYMPGESPDNEHSRMSERLLVAAYLHQAPDSTELTIDKIRDQFGEEIAALVHAVSDEPGSTRQERKQRTYTKTRAQPDAVILNLATWIADLEASLRGSNRRDTGKATNYAEDYPLFRAALYTEGQADEMWACLDRLVEQSLPTEGDYVT